MEKTWDELEQLQPNVLKMMKNSILKNRVAHAYLFEGMRGTGKKEISILLAKSINLSNAPIEGYKPCESCVNCKRINSGNHPDIHIVEPDGLSIKKDQIQDFKRSFQKRVWNPKKSIYDCPCR